MQKLLFLCSGNYYRSRFAEILFNQRAAAAELDWQADSRAVRLPESRRYIRGPISPFAIDGLTERGITLGTDIRFPCQVTEEDLASADRIIAMKEAEHREPLETQFPAQAPRVEYWLMHDIDCVEPAECLTGIDRAVNDLIAELGNGR